MSRLKAENAAKLLWKKHVHGYEKTNIAEIAAKENVRIFYEDLEPEISGLLIVNSNVPAIFINKSQHLHRQRFTVAHELGHYLLHQPQQGVHVDKGISVQFRNEKSSEGGDAQEVESNQFAAEILMPQEIIMQFIDRNSISKITETVIEMMSTFFDVSQQSMTIRLASLGHIRI